MKIKNIIVLSVTVILAIASSAFVNTNVESEVPTPKGTNSFAEFLSHFEKVEMPFELDLESINDYGKSNKLMIAQKKNNSKLKGKSATQIAKGRLMMEYINDEMMYSRMGPPEILPIARFYPNDKMVAVVYLPYQRFRNASNLSFKLALFDLKGNRIIRQVSGEHEMQKSFALATKSRSSTQTFKIDEHGKIYQKYYKCIWKKDVKKKGIKNNEIVAYELMQSKVSKIFDDGLVKELDNTIFDDRHASLD